MVFRIAVGRFWTESDITVLITVFCLPRLRLPGPGVEEASAAALLEVRRQRAALGD